MGTIRHDVCKRCHRTKSLYNGSDICVKCISIEEINIACKPDSLDYGAAFDEVLTFEDFEKAMNESDDLAVVLEKLKVKGI